MIDGQTRVIGSSEAFFDMDLPDIQGLIQQLDLFEEKQNEAVRNGRGEYAEGAETQDQRR